MKEALPNPRPAPHRERLRKCRRVYLERKETASATSELLQFARDQLRTSPSGLVDRHNQSSRVQMQRTRTWLMIEPNVACRAPLHLHFHGEAEPLDGAFHRLECRAF